MRFNKLSGTIATLAFCTAMLLIVSTSASAKDNILHSFTGPDGMNITAGLVFDAAGNLYGVARDGGANGFGSVFELSPQAGGGWTFSTLYSFENNCIDGIAPQSTLVFDASGNLYGTTVYGGPYSNACSNPTPPVQLGYGTVFELSPPGPGSGSWTETILHNFTGSTTYTDYDGANPESGVILDAKGNVYGTTSNADEPSGSSFLGTVFELIKDRGWEQHALHVFSPFLDARFPVSGLVMDAAGNLYGTTPYGGPFSNGAGAIYKVTPGTDGKATETVLYTFYLDGGTGTNPYGNLLIDAEGNLYGTTSGTGIGTLSSESEVFELSNNGADLHVLYRFAGNGNGRDISAGLVFDSAGNLYGTSATGGINVNCGNPAGGCGTVFKLTRGADDTWTEQQLHSFNNENGDGFLPVASLIFGPDGNLYGTTFYGGDLAACTPLPSLGCGTVFEIAP